MNLRNVGLRIAGCATARRARAGSPIARRGVAVSLTLLSAAAMSLCLIPRGTHAGILRDVMVSVGLAKPPPSTTPGASGPETLPRQGFACCDLHYSRDWINDGNYAELPMIAAGTPVELLSYGSNRAYVKIDGKPMRLGHDYGRDQETLQAWVGKIVVNDDPRPRISSYAPTVQAAIREGKVMVGMTREQAIVAVGYPLTSENSSLDAPVWRVWRSSHGEYQLNFGPDGRIKSITGDDGVTSLVTYRP
ncbi:MAG: hypothetical protein M3O41_19925 [Pseudomonadota bacterium]|nr:hypothetical protein [Pseudomonadota bacterium]